MAFSHHAQKRFFELVNAVSRDMPIFLHAAIRALCAICQEATKSPDRLHLCSTLQISQKPLLYRRRGRYGAGGHYYLRPYTPTTERTPICVRHSHVSVERPPTDRSPRVNAATWPCGISIACAAVSDQHRSRQRRCSKIVEVVIIYMCETG